MGGDDVCGLGAYRTLPSVLYSLARQPLRRNDLSNVGVQFNTPQFDLCEFSYMHLPLQNLLEACAMHFLHGLRDLYGLRQIGKWHTNVSYQQLCNLCLLLSL